MLHAALYLHKKKKKKSNHSLILPTKTYVNIALLGRVERNDKFTSKRGVIANPNFLEHQLRDANVTEIDSGVCIR